MASDTDERTPTRRSGSAARRDRSTGDEQHQHDRQALWDRERARRRESERDHADYRRRERERRRRYDSDRPFLDDAIRDAEWVAHSLTRASVRAVFGTVSVIEDLLLNLTDSYFSIPIGRGEGGDGEARGDDADDHGRSRTAERLRSSVTRYTSDLYEDLSQAVRDEADVLADAVNEFARDDDDDGDDNTGGSRRSRRRGAAASTEPPAA